MDKTPRNDILHPRGEGSLRKSYLPQKTRKVKYLPPAEAFKLLSGARKRSLVGNIKKSGTLEVPPPSRPKNVRVSTKIAISDANFHSLAAKQTWKSYQESRKAWRPLDIGLKESESCMPNSNPIPPLNDHGGSVDSEQKAGSEIGREKGETSTKIAESGMGQKKGKEVPILHDSGSLSIKPREFRQQNFSWARAENMADAPATSVVNPRGEEAVTKRNYIQPKKCRTKYITPAEAIQLMPGTHGRRRKKPSPLNVQVRSMKTRPSYSRKAGAVPPVADSGADSHPSTNNANTKTPKPSGVRFEGSGSGFPSTKLNPAANRKGGSTQMKTGSKNAKLAGSAGKGLAGR